jgi:hypothetical protein
MLPAMLAALEIDATTIVALLIGAVGAGTSVGGLVAKRQKDLGELYKSLYEGKSAEVSEINLRVGHLEAQVALFQSDFMKQLAEGITEAIVRSVEGRIGDHH